jgi:hypothetical protein
MTLLVVKSLHHFKSRDFEFQHQNIIIICLDDIIRQIFVTLSQFLTLNGVFY